MLQRTDGHYEARSHWFAESDSVVQFHNVRPGNIPPSVRRCALGLLPVAVDDTVQEVRHAVELRDDMHSEADGQLPARKGRCGEGDTTSHELGGRTAERRPGTEGRPTCARSAGHTGVVAESQRDQHDGDGDAFQRRSSVQADGGGLRNSPAPRRTVSWANSSRSLRRPRHRHVPRSAQHLHRAAAAANADFCQRGAGQTDESDHGRRPRRDETEKWKGNRVSVETGNR